MSAPTQTRCALSLWWGAHSRIALEVASEQPLGTVLDDTVSYLREYLDAAGATTAEDQQSATEGAPEQLPEAPWGWRLRTPLGTFLDNALSLAEQGVRRGAELELVPASPHEEFTPRIENVSAAVAEISRREFASATVGDITRLLAMTAAGIAAAATVAALVAAYRHPHWATVGVAAGAGALWLLSAMVTALRARTPGYVRDAVWVGAIALSPAAAAAVTSLLWALPPLLTAAGLTVALAAVALLGARHRSALTAVLVVAVLTVFSQAFSARTEAPGPLVCCVLVVVIVSMLGRAELSAQRYARIPRSVFPSGSGRFIGRRRSALNPDELEPAAVPPDPADLRERVITSNRILVGLLVGYGICAAAVAAVIVMRWGGHSLAWLAFAVGLPVVWAFRVWSYSGRQCIAALLFGVAISSAAIIVALALTRGLWWALAACTVVVLAAAVSPLTIPTQLRPQSPLVRGARVLAEYMVTLAVLLAPVGLLNIPYLVYNGALW